MDERKAEWIREEGARVGLVGATGLVGEKMRAILAERSFPVRSMRFFASKRSAGRSLPWGGEPVPVEVAEEADFDGLDLVFFSAGGATSRALAPQVAAAGALVIDNSSAWRSDPDVPLVVSEVNPAKLADVPKGIVANPNCTTMVAMPVLAPLHAEAGLARLLVSSYQAASGAGRAGVDELEAQLALSADARAGLVDSGEALAGADAKQWSVPLGFNVVAQNYALEEDGFTDEERKLRDESRKILDLPGLRVAGTCVRVPVFTGHSLAVHAEFERPLDVARAQALLDDAPGVERVALPNPLAATGRDPVQVGRIRRDPTTDNGLIFFVSGDNVRKGAALNAIQVAEVWWARSAART